MEIFILIARSIYIFSNYLFIGKYIVRIICGFFIQRVFLKSTIITDEYA